MDFVAANTCLYKRAECEAAKNHTHLFIVAKGDTCPTPKTVSIHADPYVHSLSLCLCVSVSLSLFSFSLCGFLFFLSSIVSMSVTVHVLSFCLFIFLSSIVSRKDREIKRQKERARTEADRETDGDKKR